MAPLDRVHRLLQTQGSNPAVISGETAEYKGVVDCFRRILAEQGMMAFWRGHIASSIPPILQMGVHQKCVALPINDFLKRYAPKYDPKTDYYKDFLVKLVSGGAAGGLANLAFYPIGTLALHFEFKILQFQNDFRRRQIAKMSECLSRLYRCRLQQEIGVFSFSVSLKIFL